MAAPATEAPSEPVRKIDHLAVVVAGKDKVIKQAKLKELQDIWKNKGAQEVLEAEADEVLADKQPNFQELESVLQNISVDSRKKTLLGKSKLMQEIVEGANLDIADKYVQAVAQVAATMPGMTTAISAELGIPIAKVRELLADPKLSRTSPVGKAIEGRFLKDEKFVALLRKNIGENLEKPEDLIKLDEEIKSKDELVSSTKLRIDAQKASYTNSSRTGSVDVIEDMRSSKPADFNTLKTQVDQFNNASQLVTGNSVLRELGIPTIINSATDAEQLCQNIDDKIAELGENLMASHADKVPKKTPKVHPTTGVPTGGFIDPMVEPENRNKLTQLKTMWDKAHTLQLALSNPTLLTNMQHLNAYSEYIGGPNGGIKKTLDTEQAENDKLKVDVTTKRSIRDRMVNDVSQKVDRMMNKTVKDYYNQVVLKQVDRVVEYEAAQKAEDKKKAEDLAQLREQKCKEIMDRFLHMSFLKYEGDKVVGWEDTDLKDFVKKDMLSKSPAKMAQDLLDRVYQNRSTIPPDYKKEIDAMMKEMGVTKGPPAVNAKDVFKSIKTETYQKWAEEKVPDILGYAWARGYYFDRLKIKPAEREYLKLAYKDSAEDFFVSALNHKKNYVADVEKMLGEDFTDGGVVSREKIKRFLVGKDWMEGMKKLWKVTQVLGAGFVLGGGLGSAKAFDLLNPATYAPFFKDGAAIATHNAKQVVQAGMYTVAAASKASGVAINTITGNLAPPGIEQPVGGIQGLMSRIKSQSLVQPPYK